MDRYSAPFKRIGIAHTRPSRSDGRVDRYGIFEVESGTLYAKYEGYDKGTGSYGLPLAGVGAAHTQSFHQIKTGDVFDLAGFSKVNFFEGNPWCGMCKSRDCKAPGWHFPHEDSQCNKG